MCEHRARTAMRFSLSLLLAIVLQLFLVVGQAEALTYGFMGGHTLPSGRANAWDDIENWYDGNYTGLVANHQTAYFDGDAVDFQGEQFRTVANLGLGYYGNNSALRGHGTLAVQTGTLTVTSSTRLGRVKSGYGEHTGTLNIEGGTLLTPAITDAGTTGVNDIHVTSGVLDVGYGGTNHSVTGNANVTFEFTGGTIQNITTGRITDISGSGTVSNLTDVLTLDTADPSTFSGNITGSGSGNVTKINTGMLTLAPGGLSSIGTMSLVGLTTGSNSTTLDFDLTTPGGSGDLITIGSGGLTVNPNTAISFGTTPTAFGNYRLIGGTFGAPTLSNFDLPTPPAGKAYVLSTTVDPGYIDFAVAIPGDANLDVVVDLQDFTILKANFGMDPAVWEDANFNLDTVVDLQDFTIMKAHYGQVGSAAATPEPATVLLAALGGLGLLRRRRRL